MRVPRAVAFVRMLLALQGVGCTPERQTVSSPTPGVDLETPSVGPLAEIRRDCASAVAGALPPDWRRLSLIAGPVAMVWLADAGSIPPSSLGSVGRGYVPIKVLVLVDRGRTERLSVAPGNAASVSLLYDPSTFSSSGRYDFNAGSQAVVFTACGGRSSGWSSATQFNGGIIARGPVCLHLMLRTGAASVLTKRVVVPIARGSSCPGSAGA